MNPQIPDKVHDQSKFRHAWNKLIDWLIRSELKSSSDIFVNSSTAGTTLTLVNKGGNQLPTIEVTMCINGAPKTAIIYGKWK